MLKKIVKYGNSSALVLDKALLELLNMAEGSIVKIKTDGVSLIITPQNPLTQETISPTLTIENTFKDIERNLLSQSLENPEKAEAFQAELKSICERYRKSMEGKMNNEANPAYAEEIKRVETERMNLELDVLLKKYPSANSPDWDSTDTKLLTEEFTKVHSKYKHLVPAISALMETPEYIHEMMLLAEKYQNVPDATHSKEYVEASTQIISKSIPEYAVYQKELKKLAEWTQRSATLRKKKAPLQEVDQKKR